MKPHCRPPRPPPAPFLAVHTMAMVSVGVVAPIGDRPRHVLHVRYIIFTFNGITIIIHSSNREGNLSPRGYITFDLCQDGKCVEAGKVFIFGATMEPVDNVLPVDDKHFHLYERSVVDVMIKQGWTLEKPLVAKTRSSIVGNLPKPVVILKELLRETGPWWGNRYRYSYGPGNVTLSPGEKPGNYGNLLQKYFAIDGIPN